VDVMQGIAIFFDIGDTLASPVVDGGRLVGLAMYPLVPDVLRLARVAAGDDVPVAIGLISNTGTETSATMTRILAASGLAALVDVHLCLFSSVEGVDKSQPALFTRARDRAGLPAARCVYVGEDPTERAVARSAGFRVSPQPLHALQVVATEFSTDLPPD
jgi:FMN phosphatase YigB (HAD superfamily)